ncbi:interleukin 12 receptor, beta 2a, like [Seriola aureovittata]|uniref:interleukin 12 receptor, beta 2a, like n=1 Tax=Seriola aureovittata TaxID=2871759 RepID=UPI0024BE5937|nr:interleukin 12 receptor, beta 2a, like [Seriola aureovittata]
MATLRTRWLLSMLLVNLPNCCTPTDPPTHPSLPECYFPCDEESCNVDIHCAWDPGPDPHFTTNYSLHWEPAISKGGYVNSQTSSSAVIVREDFANHGKIRVWVKAENLHGSFTSPVVDLNIADINKPPPPNIKLRQQKSIEIEWHSFCDELGFSEGVCYVRNRIEADRVWLEYDSGLLRMHMIESPQPCTIYEIQVRCACATGLISDWSTIHRIKSTETDPLGKPDIWWDCGTSPASFNCALTWKNLAASQACSVLGYTVTRFYNNGTTVSITVESGGLCNKMQCHLNTSLKDVSSFNVSAFNTYGATEPSHLVMPVPGKEKNEQVIQLNMNEVNLTVSWDLPSQHTDNLKEYVVQYKQAGCPTGKGFDWIKVKKNQTVFFKGPFKKVTPFQVSLFSVSHSLEVHHLSSVIGYSLEGTPSRVRSFKVFPVAPTQVKLSWEPVPLFERNGVIQYYQIRLNRQNVYNVSATQHENKNFELKHLSPGQEYEVSIRAVTVAGPGANVTTKFKTEQDENFVHLIPAVLVPSLVFLLVVICILVLLCCCRGEKVCPLVTSCFCEKVPDPSNSHIFRQMKHQINDSLAWICIPVNEQHPNISMLEVVEIQPGAFMSSPEKTSDTDGLTRPILRDGCSQMDCQDDQSENAVLKQGGRTDHRYGRKEYSKMVDSDEERDKEEDRDDCWSSSDEEQLTSGYEKHFMPTASEILEA